MTRADILEAWQAYLSEGRRRSPHTVWSILAMAVRLLDTIGEVDWPALARLDAAALRAQLARRRAEGLTNVAARELSALKGFIAFARSQAGMADPPRRECAGRASRRVCRARSRLTRR